MIAADSSVLIDVIAGSDDASAASAEAVVVRPGAFVRCAVTGESIPLDELKYWSVERQEAYLNAEVSLGRELDIHPEWRKRG